MSNNVIGRVYLIGPIKIREYQDKEFFERDITIDATRHDQYTGDPGPPNFPTLTVKGEERCRQLEEYNKGDLLEIQFFLNGFKYEKEGEERFFTKPIAYKIERKSSSIGSKVSAVASAPDDVDDLPFA